MDWDSNIPTWNLEELEQEAEPNLGSLLCSSSILECQTNELDCSVDLKLGGLGDFGSSDKVEDQTRASIAMVSPSISSKRVRTLSNGIQNASCLVDGCNAALSNCREYHRRHKVCEVHSKTPIVLVNGQEQRFCQQCSRFHLLVEFDEVKRSCRKRLDGHNRRRRKPLPDTAYTGSLFVNHQSLGPRFSNYSQMFPTTPESNWVAVVKTEKETAYGHGSLPHFVDRQRHSPGSFPRCCGEGKELAFLPDSDSSLSNGTTETSLCQPVLDAIASSESSNSKFNGLPRLFDSDCALSLLSLPTQNSGVNLSHIVPADPIPMGQPLVSSLHQYGGPSHYSHPQALSSMSRTEFPCSAMEDEHVGTVLVSGAGDADLHCVSGAGDADLHCQDMFHVVADGALDGTAQAIPFSWQ